MRIKKNTLEWRTGKPNGRSRGDWRELGGTRRTLEGRGMPNRGSRDYWRKWGNAERID